MKITEISNQLSTAYFERAEMKFDLTELEDDLRRREVALTPADGWQGKNMEVRDLEKYRTLAADSDYTAILNDVVSVKHDLALLEGTIAALETQRRGLEWEIRENLVATLAYNLRGMQTPATEAESPEQAFDDVMGSIVDEEIFYTASEDLADHETLQELAEATIEPDEEPPF